MRQLRIRFDDLPPRERPLDDQALGQIFGGNAAPDSGEDPGAERASEREFDESILDRPIL